MDCITEPAAIASEHGGITEAKVTAPSGCIKRTKRALNELTDKTLPEEEQMKKLNILARHCNSNSQCHSVNSHKSGDIVRIELHLSFEKNANFEKS